MVTARFRNCARPECRLSTDAVLRNGYITNHVFSVDGGMHPR